MSLPRIQSASKFKKENNCNNTKATKKLEQNPSELFNVTRLNDSLDMLTTNLKSYLKRQQFHQMNHNLQNEWKLIALIFDRLLFWIFTLVTLISSIILLVIVPLVKNKVNDSYV